MPHERPLTGAPERNDQGVQTRLIIVPPMTLLKMGAAWRWHTMGKLQPTTAKLCPLPQSSAQN